MCQETKWGFIFAWEDSSGFHNIGTKNLLDKFKSHNDEAWKRASNLDTLFLNSCEDHEVRSVAPEQTGAENIISATYAGSQPALLETKLELMNEKESRKYIVTEIK